MNFFDLIVVLFALATSAGLIYQFYLSKINAYLKLNHPEDWVKHGFGNRELNLLARLNRLRDFSVQFTSDDEQLERMLNTTSFIHRGFIVMLILILASISYAIFYNAIV